MDPRILAATFAYNEGAKITQTLARFPQQRDCDILVVDDGTTDGSVESLQQFNVKMLRNETNRGLGFSMKRAFQYTLDEGYDILVILAGNNKDDPTEIPRLLEPILKHGYDYVQGSRYLPGGDYGNMPFYRAIATRYVHPILFSLAVGTRVTESTNGFRALRVSILRDDRIDWRQDWLDRYELEQYVRYKVIRLGYKHTEVPVTKIYPTQRRGYTKVKAITGWWSMLRPVVYLRLGLKR
jgi:dolichol-phosphate mannosyltransferase